MDLISQILPQDKFENFINILTQLNTETQKFVGSMMEGFQGMGAAFSDAIFSAISGEESLANALKRSMAAWLKTWGNKMMLQSLEYAAMALGKGAMQDWPGAAQAAGASVAYGAAAAAAGLGARALKITGKKKASSRGTSRGLGGAASRGGDRGPVTFNYSINTVIPPDPEDAATTVAGFYNKAANMGLIARAS